MDRELSGKEEVLAEISHAAVGVSLILLLCDKDASTLKRTILGVILLVSFVLVSTAIALSTEKKGAALIKEIVVSGGAYVLLMLVVGAFLNILTWFCGLLGYHP